MAPHLLKLIAHLVFADTGAPVNTPALRVRFYDHDLVGRDRLGESGLSPEGVAEVVCTQAHFQSGVLGRLFERLREKKPDIYIEVVDSEGVPLYRSPVTWNIDPAKVNEVTRMSERTIDLGVYRFRTGEGVIDPSFDRPFGRGPLM